MLGSMMIRIHIGEMQQIMVDIGHLPQIVLTMQIWFNMEGKVRLVMHVDVVIDYQSAVLRIQTLSPSHTIQTDEHSHERM